jgi:hypothetical protein
MIIPDGKHKTVFKVKKGTATMVCTTAFLKSWLDRGFMIKGFAFIDESESLMDMMDVPIPDNIE